MKLLQARRILDATAIAAGDAPDAVSLDLTFDPADLRLCDAAGPRIR